MKVCVENSEPKLSILIDPQEFLPKLSLLKDEMMKLRAAVQAGRDYELPERHDPIYLMFDNDFHLGAFGLFVRVFWRHPRCSCWCDLCILVE